ncbi:hypothetical protein D3C80_1564450 [compost metagenome]
MGDQVMADATFLFRYQAKIHRFVVRCGFAGHAARFIDQRLDITLFAIHFQPDQQIWFFVDRLIVHQCQKRAAYRLALAEQCGQGIDHCRRIFFRLAQQDLGILVDIAFCRFAYAAGGQQHCHLFRIKLLAVLGLRVEEQVRTLRNLE